MGQTCTPVHPHVCNMDTRTHTHTHARTRTRAHTHKRTHNAPALEQVCECAVWIGEGGGCIISHRFIALYGTHCLGATQYPPLLHPVKPSTIQYNPVQPSTISTTQYKSELSTYPTLATVLISPYTTAYCQFTIQHFYLTLRNHTQIMRQAEQHAKSMK